MIESEIRVTECWTWHAHFRGVKIGALVAIVNSGLEVHSLGLLRICGYLEER